MVYDTVDVKYRDRISYVSIISSGAHPLAPRSAAGHLLTFSVPGVRHSKILSWPRGLGMSLSRGDPRVFNTRVFERWISCERDCRYSSRNIQNKWLLSQKKIK